MGVFELILGTPDIRQAIYEKLDYPSIAKMARDQGFRSMVEDGKAKAMAGWTTPEQVIKAVYSQAIE